MVGAVARASIIPGTREAEYAILISRFLIGQGLGRQLMRKLVKWGRGKYLDRLYGDVAAENEPMKQLAASLGFKPVPHPAPKAWSGWCWSWTTDGCAGPARPRPGSASRWPAFRSANGR